MVGRSRRWVFSKCERVGASAKRHGAGAQNWAGMLLAYLAKSPNATAGLFVVEGRGPTAGSVEWRAGRIRWRNWLVSALLP